MTLTLDPQYIVANGATMAYYRTPGAAGKPAHRHPGC